MKQKENLDYIIPEFGIDPLKEFNLNLWQENYRKNIESELYKDSQNNEKNDL